MIAMLEQRITAIGGAVRDHAVYTVCPDGCIESWSASAERVHHWPASQVVGQSMAMFLPGAARETVQAQLLEMLAQAAASGWCEVEGNRLRGDGSTFTASTIITTLRAGDGTATGFSVVTRDLSERRKLEEATRSDSSSDTDYSTGAVNRRAFFDVASSEVSRARRYGQPLALLLVAPDNFRAVTGTYGEAMGGEWLRAMATHCRQESRTMDVVGRAGGEEFAVLLPNTELSGGLVLAERIRERMQRHVFTGDARALRCTVSVGVAEVTGDITSMEELLTAASTAVDRARQAGMNLVVGYDA